MALMTINETLEMFHLGQMTIAQLINNDAERNELLIIRYRELMAKYHAEDEGDES